LKGVLIYQNGALIAGKENTDISRKKTRSGGKTGKNVIPEEKEYTLGKGNELALHFQA